MTSLAAAARTLPFLVLLSLDICPPRPCVYTVLPTAAPVPATGGNILVRVATTSNCAWTFQSNVPWLKVGPDPDATGQTGKGNGSVILAVEPNQAAARRTGTAIVATRTITVDQAGTGPSGCTFQVSPGEAVFTGGGAGTGQFMITASAADCGWTATRSSILEDTVNLTAGGNGGGAEDRYGVGSSAINYQVKAQSPTSPWPAGGGEIVVRDAAQQVAATYRIRFQ